MKVWRIESRWSVEFVLADSIDFAISRYLANEKKQIKKENPQPVLDCVADPTIMKVELLGEVIE